MAKILLVEDDNNLREIYEARLQAEGYEIVSAKDGEEALVVAKKERPDLIIADVMMPRVSGFEMLDIIRNTPELKEVHVIMLTALGQAEDKTRADSLGADRYLVKSQVTLEDIVKAAADVLAGVPAGAPTAAVAASPAQPAAPTDAQAAAVPVATPPPAPLPEPVQTPAPIATEPVQPTARPTQPPPSTPPVQDVTAPPQVTPPEPASAAIPVTTPPADVSTPAPAAPIAAPPAQDPSNTNIPEPSATDSQLVTDAVNNLVAGTDSAQATPAAPAPTPAPSVPAVPPTVPPAAPDPVQTQTMQPVLAPPPVPVAQPAAPVVTPPPLPAPAPAIADVTPPNESGSAPRKAITPLPADPSSAPPNLNDLLAREGHDMNDNQNFDAPAHMPGNVIAPGASGAPTTPPATNPADPNSISL